MKKPHRRITIVKDNKDSGEKVRTTYTLDGTRSKKLTNSDPKPPHLNELDQIQYNAKELSAIMQRELEDDISLRR